MIKPSCDEKIAKPKKAIAIPFSVVDAAAISFHIQLKIIVNELTPVFNKCYSFANRLLFQKKDKSIFPADLTVPDLLAISLLFATWSAYSLVLNKFARGSLNTKLGTVREIWIANSTTRPNRMFDAVMLGHIMHSVSFFGSATLLVLAGVIGTFVNLQSAYDLISSLHFTATTSLELFTIKLLVVGGLLIITFFLFTYSLRKFVYTVALMGALPEHDEEHQHKNKLTKAASTVLTEAVKSFNNGIRGYYFAASALFLFVNPWMCILTTLGVSAMLLYRQTNTATSKAIEDYVASL